MAKTERLCLDVEKGEVITFERGVIIKGAATGKDYLVKKLKIREHGLLEALEKEEIKNTRR